jgi:hypothetical protein
VKGHGQPRRRVYARRKSNTTDFPAGIQRAFLFVFPQATLYINAVCSTSTPTLLRLLLEDAASVCAVLSWAAARADIASKQSKNTYAVTQTASEQYLSSLSERSFLSLWSFPSLYTDEGRTRDKGTGRELCDLLVVFGKDVLIFSDKHCSYKDTGNESVDWPRWYRKAVRASIAQIYGAESWLARFPARVFLDPECSKQFPIALPSIAERRVHRLAVTRGAMDACNAFFGGKSIASLRISSDPAAGSPGYVPFTAGTGLPGKPFVHVLDEYTLDVLFKHLDTVTDFVNYLVKKEKFFSVPGRQVMADGEEQLLGIYLTKLNEDGDHDIVLAEPIPPDVDSIWINEGIWESVSTNKQLKAKAVADEISYAWDRLIEQFARTADPSLIRPVDSAEDEHRSLEQSLRVMAAESRFSRRNLARSLLDVHARSKSNKTYARLMPSHTNSDVVYVLLAQGRPQDISYSEYRQYRVGRLMGYVRVAPLRIPTARRIVGIAFDSATDGEQGGSEDLICQEISDWTPALEQEAREIQKELEILLDENVQMMDYHDTEYPNVPVTGEAQQAKKAASRLRKRKEKAKEKMRKQSRARNRKK